MNVIEPFGPRIAQFKLTTEQTSSLFKICNPTKGENFTKNLVGFIKEEIDITDELKKLKVFNTISNNIHRYFREVDSAFFGDVLKSGEIDNIFECTKAWYNKAIANEYQPIHDHIIADLVCVVYPKIDLDNNPDYYYTSSKQEQKGQINFKFGERQISGYGLSTITIEPQEGDMFVFPGHLSHYTDPILGDSVRYSISCNFNYTNSAKRIFDNLVKNKDNENRF